eukprot:scaffold73464_cov48-Phaeocystis_antarctica.AAC.1
MSRDHPPSRTSERHRTITNWPPCNNESTIQNERHRGGVLIGICARVTAAESMATARLPQPAFCAWRSRPTSYYAHEKW